MKTFKNQAAQGDIWITRIPTIPANAVPQAPTGERHVVAHSESGHDHFVLAVNAEFWEDPSDPALCYLRVGDGADLSHDKPDEATRHGTIRIPTGSFRIVRQRERAPEGWDRRVAD